jgi:hypothetical protein
MLITYGFALAGTSLSALNADITVSAPASTPALNGGRYTSRSKRSGMYVLL